MSKFPAWRHGRHVILALPAPKTIQRSDSSSNRYSQASTEAGFNAMDWSLRGRYILTDDNGNRNAEYLYLRRACVLFLNA